MPVPKRKTPRAKTRQRRAHWKSVAPTYAYENGGLPTNERLEFLGDAVLGLVVTDIIYRAFPDLPEGQLAKLRAATVNMNVLAEVARELGIGDAVRHPPAHRPAVPRTPPADVVPADGGPAAQAEPAPRAEASGD